MGACCCSLDGTRACLSCTNHQEEFTWTIPSGWYEQVKNIPRAKCIIEKFDKDGKIIERITEG